MLTWIKNKLGITELENKVIELNQSLEKEIEQRIEFENQVSSFKTKLTVVGYNIHTINESLSELHKLNTIDVDVGYRGQNTIILTGVFNGKGYVQFYDLHTEEFGYLVKQLKDMNKHQWVRNIDCPFDFKGGFDI